MHCAHMQILERINLKCDVFKLCFSMITFLYVQCVYALHGKFENQIILNFVSFFATLSVCNSLDIGNYHKHPREAGYLLYMLTEGFHALSHERGGVGNI